MKDKDTIPDITADELERIMISDSNNLPEFLGGPHRRRVNESQYRTT